MIKSYKREVAAVLLVFWAILVIRAFFFVDNPKDFVNMIVAITAAVTPLCMAAFGLHAYLNKDR